MTASFREIEHTADAGAEITGKDVADVFAGAIAALYSVMGKAQGVEAGRQEEELWRFTLEATDLASLLVAFLNEALYLFETVGAIFNHLSLDICSEQPSGLSAKIAARGELYEEERHGSLREVKAAAQHRASFKKVGEVFIATVFFDM